MDSKDAKRRAQLKAREQKRQHAHKQMSKKRERKIATLSDAFLDMTGRWLNRDHNSGSPFTDECPDCKSEIRLSYADGCLHYAHPGEWCEGWATFHRMQGNHTPPLETLTSEAIDAKYKGVEDIRFNRATGNIDVTGPAINGTVTDGFGTKATGSVSLSTSPNLDPRLPAWAQGVSTRLSVEEGRALIASGKVKSSLTIQRGSGARVDGTEVIARTAEGLFRFPATGTHVLPRSV